MLDKLQIRLTSSAELMRSTLEPYLPWIEQSIGASLDQTLTVEVDSNPADLIAEQLLQGVPVVSATKARNRSWRALVDKWSLPSGLSPRIASA
jgi:hypothetical protein